jgi:putative transposase
MKNGFMYLTAIIDIYSRKIVGWGLSNSLDAESSLRVVRDAIKSHGRPEIMNSDQGSQFTYSQYIELLQQEKIRISMDGKGRAIDNIFIERFWRSIKYRHIYLNPAEDGIELFKGIMIWIDKYNNRKHQATKQKPNVRYQNAA